MRFKEYSPVEIDFNSHPREGGDQTSMEDYLRMMISIPTPARGVTAKMHIYSIENLAFLPYFLRNASKNFFLYSRSAKFFTHLSFLFCADLPANHV